MSAPAAEHARDGKGPADAAPTPPRLDALTGIRGLAAWLVVFYHVRASISGIVPGWAIDLFAKGYLAVDLFFVLSGFVLWLTYGERLGRRASGGAWPFLWRRFTRVWPLHAFVLALFVMLATVLAARGHANPRYPFAELPLHVLLVQNWGLTDHLRWNDPAWSISTEFAAYLLFPLIACAVRWDTLRPTALLAIAALLCAAVFALFTSAGTASLGEQIVRLGLWRCLAEFCLGIVACLLWRNWQGARGAAGCVAIAGCTIAGLAVVLHLPETAFVPALFFTAILALALDRGPVSRVLSSRAAVYLGEISYSTYLSHFLLWIVFKMAFVDAGLQIGWAGLAGYLALVAVASVALYHGIERPAQTWLNARRPRWARTRALAAAE